MRRTAESEIFSDAISRSFAPRGSPANPPTHQRQPFGHQKDGPLQFSMLTRPSTANDSQPTPTSKSSGDYVSASSTSLYAHSIVSSSFTLWSTTDNSSASSAFSARKPNADDLPITPSQKPISSSGITSGKHLAYFGLNYQVLTPPQIGQDDA